MVAIRFRRDGYGGYWAGCRVRGESRQDAMERMRLAVSGYLRCWRRSSRPRSPRWSGHHDSLFWPTEAAM